MPDWGHAERRTWPGQYVPEVRGMITSPIHKIVTALEENVICFPVVERAMPWALLRYMCG
jgi:hypothetical protein